MRTILVLFLSLSCASAFTVTRQPRHETQLFGGAAGFSTSLEGKKATVEKVKGLLENSDLVFSVPSSSITVAQAQNLRRSLPEGTTCTVIKNKLMARAIEGSDYEPLSKDLLKGANI